MPIFYNSKEIYPIHYEPNKYIVKAFHNGQLVYDALPIRSNLSDYSLTELADIALHLQKLTDTTAASDPVYTAFEGFIGQTIDFGTYVSGSELDQATNVEQDKHFLCRLVGVRHDDYSSSKKCGLTFGTVCSLPLKKSSYNKMSYTSSTIYYELNSTSTNGTIRKSIPTALQNVVRSCNKVTNSQTSTSSAVSLTTSSMEFWLFSAAEVYGSSTISSWSDKQKAVYPKEGTQYEYFEDLGVTFSSGSALKNLNLGKTISGASPSAGGTPAYDYVMLRTHNPSGSQAGCISTNGSFSVAAGNVYQSIMVGFCL